MIEEHGLANMTRCKLVSGDEATGAEKLSLLDHLVATLYRIQPGTEDHGVPSCNREPNSSSEQDCDVLRILSKITAHCFFLQRANQSSESCLAVDGGTEAYLLLFGKQTLGLLPDLAARFNKGDELSAEIVLCALIFLSTLVCAAHEHGLKQSWEQFHLCHLHVLHSRELHGARDRGEMDTQLLLLHGVFKLPLAWRDEYLSLVWQLDLTN